MLAKMLQIYDAEISRGSSFMISVELRVLRTYTCFLHFHAVLYKISHISFLDNFMVPRLTQLLLTFHHFFIHSTKGSAFKNIFCLSVLLSRKTFIGTLLPGKEEFSKIEVLIRSRTSSPSQGWKTS